MTSEEKRDKREARRQVEASLRPLVRRAAFNLRLSPKKERQFLRTLVDRFYAEQVTPAAKRIEKQVLSEAVKRMEAASA